MTFSKIRFTRHSVTSSFFANFCQNFIQNNILDKKKVVTSHNDVITNEIRTLTRKGVSNGNNIYDAQGIIEHCIMFFLCAKCNTSSPKYDASNQKKCPIFSLYHSSFFVPKTL